MTIKQINDWGKARANKYARVANNMLLSDNCECLDIPVCSDVITSNLNANLIGVTVDGITYNINTIIYDASGQVIWQPTRFDSAGFKTRGAGAAANHPYITEFLVAVLSQIEVDPYINITPLGVITHIGAYEITIFGSAAGYVAAPRCCTVVDNAFVC